MTRTVLAILLAFCAWGGCARRGSAPPDTSTTVVALDGADWRNALPLVRQGKLPVIQAIRRAGASAVMRTNPDFRWSPVLWTSIATGKLPEKHGVTSFMAQVPGLPRRIPTPSTARQCRAIWNIFSERGRSVGFVGWWVTWPAEPVNGFMVSDHFSVSRFDLGRDFNVDDEDPSLSAKQTYPDDLLERIGHLKVSRRDVGRDDLARFADLPADFEFPETLQKFDSVSEFAIANSVDRTHYAAAAHLLAESPPELFGVFLQGIDIMQHYNWEFMDPAATGTNPSFAERRIWSAAVERYYAYADGLIGSLVEGGGDRAILIVSDHGFRPGTERYAEKHISGEHRRQAFFAFAGPGVRRGARIDDVDAVDVTPTLLTYHGLPAAADMDGAAVLEAFTPEWRTAHPAETIETYETGPWKRAELPQSAALEGLEERIRTLGYIE